ncbi:MAG: tRNA (cytidine(34)-2'-O)-methyltransferase [Devosiaceae bacterium]|nr:tRNA (cytidine(34)-2'-O)-methyltransferase [Devosiaceae bacterium]
MELALYQPDIPQNTGTILRLGACLNVPVHIIHPTGFHFSDKLFRRSAMDYAQNVQMHEHDSFQKFDLWRKQRNKRLVLMTTKTQKSVYEFEFNPGDILLAGRESAGVPTQVASICNALVRLPMAPRLRSLNVSLATAMILGEALRQTDGFDPLS